MKLLFVSLLTFVYLQGSTWQDIQSNIQTKTSIDVSGNIDRSVLKFDIDGFHLIPVNTPSGEMFIVNLEDGASILKEGAPDLDKFSRSIVIPDDKQMEVIVVSSDYIDYENILIAPSKGLIPLWTTPQRSIMKWS